MLCRSVQVERPRVSTSGGQSDGCDWDWRAWEGVCCVDWGCGCWVEDEMVEEDLLACLVKARQEAAEVQRRHLF